VKHISEQELARCAVYTCLEVHPSVRLRLRRSLWLPIGTVENIVDGFCPRCAFRIAQTAAGNVVRRMELQRRLGEGAADASTRP
jgi:hypothetical protein